MRKLLAHIGLVVALVLPVGVGAFTVPTNPTGYVNDFANVLSVEQKDELEQKLVVYEEASTNEIAVVTIPSLEGDTIENVAQDIFTAWEIGKQGKDNGVLLLVSLGDRKTRIHTGYGVEGDLTDLATSYIQSDVIAPRFKEGDYFTGIDSAVDAMIEALGGTNIVPEYSSGQEIDINYDFIYLIFFIFQWILAVLARSKAWWHGGVLGGAIGGGIIWYFGVISIASDVFIVLLLIILGLIFDYIVSKAHTKAQTSGTYPWYMGGGGSGGGGDFGGFGGGRSGGGRSGGGGSSGSW